MVGTTIGLATHPTVFPPPPPLPSLFRFPSSFGIHVTALLAPAAIQMMLVGFDEVFPLWMLSTPEVGGLGWNTKQIGKVNYYSYY